MREGCFWLTTQATSSELLKKQKIRQLGGVLGEGHGHGNSRVGGTFRTLVVAASAAWFNVSGLPAVAASEKGARPGCALAYLVFSAAFFHVVSWSPSADGRGESPAEECAERHVDLLGTGGWTVSARR